MELDCDSNNAATMPLANDDDTKLAVLAPG